jgi:2-amino-4-hydroxy-6-hydroxymethyldihydropteridine diphosphokinase
LIGLGANLGDRHRALATAVAQLKTTPGVRVGAVSRILETEAVGGPPAQPRYLNGAAVIQTELEPGELLRVLQAIETRLGRERAAHWGPRCIDLDLLLYGDVRRATPDLTLPHPAMAHRRFVLEPAAEIAAGMVHAELGQSVGALWRRLRETLPYIAVAGPIGAGKSRLAADLAQAISGRLIAEPLDDAVLAAYYAEPSAWALRVEADFLANRVGLLRQATWQFPSRPAVSDFWLEQSLAFASVSLSASDYARFETACSEARREVVLPRLVIVLSAPPQLLRERIASRGRTYERNVTLDYLTRVGEALGRRTKEPNPVPVLWLDAALPFDRVFESALAAVRACLA